MDLLSDRLKLYTFPKGNFYKKIRRLAHIMEILVFCANLQPLGEDLIESAFLCKLDKIMGLTTEFPELEGWYASNLAERHKKSFIVTTAIKEHYLPLDTKGDIPSSFAGLLLGVVDRIDDLCMLMDGKEDLKGISSQDPYKIRKIAGGLVRILSESAQSFINIFKLKVPVSQIVEMALDGYEKDNIPFTSSSAKICNIIRELLVNRHEALYGKNSNSRGFIESIYGAPEVKSYEKLDDSEKAEETYEFKEDVNGEWFLRVKRSEK